MTRIIGDSKPLANAGHEKYAQNLTQGMSDIDAWEAAGYSRRNRTGACRALKREDVRARVAWLKAQSAERVVTTSNDIARQLDDDRGFARKNKQASAMVSATMGKAKVLGLIVDKHFVGIKSPDNMTEDELRAFLGIQGDETHNAGNG